MNNNEKYTNESISMFFFMQIQVKLEVIPLRMKDQNEVKLGYDIPWSAMWSGFKYATRATFLLLLMIFIGDFINVFFLMQD